VSVYLFFYDDDINPFGGTGSITAGSPEDNQIRDIVNKLETKKNIIWVVAEEYQDILSKTKVSSFASRIRHWDDYDHPIGVHQVGKNGTAKKKRLSMAPLIAPFAAPALLVAYLCRYTHRVDIGQQALGAPKIGNALPMARL